MLRWNPQRRPTAQQALRHAFFQVGQNMQTTEQLQVTQLQRRISITKSNATQKSIANDTQKKNVNDTDEGNPNKNLRKSTKESLEVFLRKDSISSAKFSEMSKGSLSSRKRWGYEPEKSEENKDEFDEILDGINTSKTDFRLANSRVRSLMFVCFFNFLQIKFKKHV